MVAPYWLDRPPTEVLDIAATANRLGATEMWIGELFHFDAFALAGYLGAKTSDMILTVGPLAAGTRDAVTLARATASVSALSARPARLALGASNRRMVQHIHDRSYGGEADRLRRMVPEIRSQLETGRSTRGYRSALGSFPAHISVAAFGPKMLEAAVHVADRIVVNLVTPEQAGRFAADAGDVGVVAWVVGALDPSAESRRQIAGQVAHYLRPPGYGEMLAEVGFGELVAEARQGKPVSDLARLIPDDLLALVGLYGSAADLAGRLEAYRAAGVDVAIVPSTAADDGGRRVLAWARDAMD